MGGLNVLILIILFAYVGCVGIPMAHRHDKAMRDAESLIRRDLLPDPREETHGH